MLRRIAIATLAVGLFVPLLMCGGSKGTNSEVFGGDGGSEGGGSSKADGSSGGADTGGAGDAAGAMDSTVQAETGAAEAGTPDTGAPPSEGGPSTGASVTQFHAHLNRDGLYADGAFTKASLAGGTLHLDSTFMATGITGEVRASPLYVADGAGGAGTFYVATESNNVYAFAESTGQMLWTKSFGPGLTKEPCGQGHTIGIRGTPAIDTATGIMVFDAATGSGSTLSKHTIYGISIVDGSTKWTLDASTLTDPVAGKFSPTDANQRSAVLIVGGIAYVAYGGYYGDCGGYHGWVIGVPLSGTGAKAYATPNGGSGIWAPGGLSSDGTSIYAATGNPEGKSVTGWGGSFSLLRLSAGPTFSGSTTDYWNAVNDTGDEDLGGSGPMLVQPAGGASLIVQLGKDGNAYLLDSTKSLGGGSSPLGMASVMNDEITTGPASATIASGTYVAMAGNASGTGSSCPAGTSGEMVVVKVTAPSAITTAWCADPMGGGSPIITTSDGSSDALVWISGTPLRNDGGGGTNQLHAWDLATGTAVVTGSDPFANVHHFTSPIVVNGRMFVAGDTRLYAYKP